MSSLSGRLAPVIHAALLANGVQLTAKELGPVSRDVATYIDANFDVITKERQAELTAAKKEEKKETPVPVVSNGVSGVVAPPPPPNGTVVQ